MSKFLVIPAFYRDVNLQHNTSNPKVPEINDIYSKIIRNVKMLSESNNFDFMMTSLAGKTQDLLLDIYNMLKEKLQGKEGYLRKYLLGKSVDYCSRIVLSGTSYDKRTNGEQNVNFYYTGVPLSHCCSLFTPFMIWWVKRFFKNEFSNKEAQYPIRDSKDPEKITYVRLMSPDVFYNDEFIESRLERFVNIPSSRFDLIEIPISEDEMKEKGIKKKPYVSIKGYETSTTTMDKNKEQPALNRHMTWTDLFYIAAVDVTEDKHIAITRYPMLDYLGTSFTRITVLSTRITKPMVINDKLYPNYPVIDLNTKAEVLDSLFKDTINICPLYLPGLDGDHDGDQITIKSVFSKEANEEIEEIMTSKRNLLTIEGSSIRKIGNEGIQTLYSMTKFRDVK